MSGGVNLRQNKSNMNWRIILLLTVLLPLFSSHAFASAALWTLDVPEEIERDQDVKKGGSQSVLPGVSWQDYFKKHTHLKKMKLGIRLEGSQSLSRNETEPMLPASVQKILTAAAALKFLGPDYRFENSFSGSLDPNSVEVFNPVFKISGDPSWGHEAFEGGLESVNENLRVRLAKVIEALKTALIQRVVGPIRIESTRPGLQLFERPAGWRDSWKLECMAMMQTEFEANGNCGQFRISSISHYGWITDGVSVPVKMKLLKSKEGANNIKVTPVFDQRGRIREYVFSGYFSRGPLVFDLPVHQGADWLRNLFIQSLERAGIEYDEGPRESSVSQESASFHVDLSSRTMLEILDQAVQFSINGVMDRIFLEIGFRMDDSVQGSWMESMVRDLVGDESLMVGVRMEDGSGLNLLNRIRSDLLFSYLSRLRDEAYFPDLFSTFAVAGKSGTLLNRSTLVSSSHTYGRIHAKTGTLNGISNLAGYFLSQPGGTPEPFVVLSDSDFSAAAARPMIDGVVVNFAAQNSGKAQN
jgi:D-alanyl-D-alanine carboxypeptidase/D-alanyl-D-alanine-endopeptidase (penicillin-binding protein 4)